MARNIKVTKNEMDPETPEILASSIVRISDSFKALSREGLTSKGIVALLMAMEGMSSVSKGDIYLVLENLPKLGSYYVRKGPQK